MPAVDHAAAFTSPARIISTSMASGGGARMSASVTAGKSSMGVAAFVRTRSIVTASASQGGGAKRAVFVWVSQLLG